MLLRPGDTGNRAQCHRQAPAKLKSERVMAKELCHEDLDQPTADIVDPGCLDAAYLWLVGQPQPDLIGIVVILRRYLLKLILRRHLRNVVTHSPDASARPVRTGLAERPDR